MTSRFPNSIRRLGVIARSLSSKTLSPTIRVEPSDALVDEPVSIDVMGLQQNQKVTLSATLKNDGKVFLSCAHYTADTSGQVNTVIHASEGGSFTGVEPMGLFWSMSPSSGQRSGSRLVKLDVTTPYIVSLSVLPNHRDLSSIQSESDIQALASTRVKRWYMGKGVQRIPVREGRIRGALFIPPGDGPFPAIVDMFGGSGGLFDFRGALLASRGFLTLSLAYMAYEDLPYYDELKFDYFLEATDWLSRHKKAQAGGIGIMGVSLGAGVAYMLATYCPQIQAVVTINGLPISPLKDQEVHGKRIKGNMLKFTLGKDGYGKVSYGFSDVNHEILSIWRQNVKILSFMSGDDMCVDPSLYHSLMDKVPQDKRENIQSIHYPGAGHLLEPPYTPLCHTSYITGDFGNGINGFMFRWGGERKSHVVAQEDAWKRTLEHFNKYLRGNNI